MSNTATSPHRGGLLLAVVYIGLAVDQLQPYFPLGARSLAFAVPLSCYLYIMWFVWAATRAPTHAIEEGIGAGH